MAFFDDPNKQQDPTQGQTAQTGGGSAPSIGGSTASDIGGVSTAGVGAGGTGGWTNIQAYLNANQGDTGSANALKNTVGSQFNDEQGKMQSDSTKAVSDAQGQFDKNKISTDQAGQMVNDNAALYDYGGTQSKAYQDNTSKMQSALNDKYSGPTSYAYGFSAPTQNYGDNLGNDQGFKGVMNYVYGKAAGQPLNSGEAELQGQLDVNNGNLSKARNDLSTQYQGLQNQRDQTVAGTTAKLNDIGTQYQDNQNNLKGYLNQQLGSYDSKVGQEQQAARDAYNGEYNSASGRQNALYGMPVDIGGATANNLYNANATWSGLQHEGDIKNNPGSAWSQPLNGQYMGQGAGYAALEAQRANANQGALQNWYGAEDQKYANTADPEKRDYNAISDFLGQTGNKKDSGFKVRG